MAISLEASLESRAKLSRTVRPWYEEEAAKAGADSTLWRTMADLFRNTMFRYITTQHDIKVYEWDAHDIWYQYIQLAMNIDAEHPAQDRLARLLLWGRELGVLSRTRKRSQLWPATEAENHEMVVQEAVTSDGRLWVDLPFLVGDLRSAWTDAMGPTTSMPHRHNLASAIARLAGLGIRNDALSGCGLAIFREALEVPRAVHHDSSEAGTIQGESSAPLGSMTIMDFQPMIMSWISYAGHKLVRLSYSLYDASAWDGAHTEPAELAVAAGVKNAGFSAARFEFWVRRMGELRQNDQEEVKAAFQLCYNFAAQTLLEVDDPRVKGV